MKCSYQRVIVAAAVIVLCVFLLLAAPARKTRQKEAVFRTVTKNLELLLADIDANTFDHSRKLHLVDKVRVSPHFIEYSCGGYGFGPATSYYGFYYSPSDAMDLIWCAGTPLNKDGDGYSFEEKDGDNRYYTEHIADHFYYYEASF